MPLTPFIGQIAPVAFPFVPRGWLPCDGSRVPVATYPDLYKLIGNTYGGDSVSFQLPDLRCRIPMGGPIGGYRLGDQVGSDLVTLGTIHLPQHTHHFLAFQGPGEQFSPVGAVNAASTKGDKQYLNVDWKQDDGCIMTSVSVLSGGPGGAYQPHENMPPCLAVNFVIAWQGIYPSRQ